eukprot:Gregarina_sp_Poly_1__9497@NODE_597_length_7261_cov_402_527940_g461_i0_p1_GENE_NODE_597_length_7261_cov_402_527940_g461_i0NODE_597_length_7261_cov_402_527940_g461_i0_p1_ORF_typecomplete_len640_score66_31Vps54_N/PF10475_9/2_5e05RPW8/PF05659_11/0_073RPW8/PF05659_11/5_2e03DUF4910/PF16254_5/0_07TSCPD/PF12637_7/0_23AcylCoA_dehyd_C/PF12186_8/0_8AcylCoA_dehyd_C/PF12186_8/2_2e03_NODE_597_length_7261_cov_402_527940_g461_i038385757
MRTTNFAREMDNFNLSASTFSELAGPVESELGLIFTSPPNNIQVLITSCTPPSTSVHLIHRYQRTIDCLRNEQSLGAISADSPEDDIYCSSDIRTILRHVGDMSAQKAHAKLTEHMDCLENRLGSRVTSCLPTVKQAVAALSGLDSQISQLTISIDLIKQGLADKNNMIELGLLCRNLQYRAALYRARNRLIDLQRIKLQVQTARSNFAAHYFEDAFHLIEDAKDSVASLCTLKCVKFINRDIQSIEEKLRLPLECAATDHIEHFMLCSEEGPDLLIHAVKLANHWQGGAEKCIRRWVSRYPRRWQREILKEVTDASDPNTFDVMVKRLTEAQYLTFVETLIARKLVVDQKLSKLILVFTKYIKMNVWRDIVDGLYTGASSVLTGICSQFWHCLVAACPGNPEEPLFSLSTTFQKTLGAIVGFRSNYNGQAETANSCKVLKSCYQSVLNDLMQKYEITLVVALFQSLSMETWIATDRKVAQSADALNDMVEKVSQLVKVVPYSKPSVIRLVFVIVEFWRKGSFDIIMTPSGILNMRKQIQDKHSEVPDVPSNSPKKLTAKHLSVYLASINRLLGSLPPLMHNIEFASFDDPGDGVRTVFGTDTGESHAVSLLLTREFVALKSSLLTDHRTVIDSVYEPN